MLLRDIGEPSKAKSVFTFVLSGVLLSQPHAISRSGTLNPYFPLTIQLLLPEVEIMTSPLSKGCSKGFENLCLEEGDVEPIDISGQEGNMFDEAIGHIEDVLMDPQFQDLQKNFMEKYWNEFDDSEENKLVYMEIFKEYTDVVEKYIENHLKRNMRDFNMDLFTSQLQERKDDLEGEVFEILFTFTDFLVFKEMFLDYKAVKEGRVADLGLNIHVSSV